MRTDNRKRSIGVKLAVIARQMGQRFDERADEIGVTRAQWALIATVSRHPGVTQRVIATKLEVTDVTAGRLIDRLCADGYLERRPHPQDRRAYCVYLTPEAQPVLARLHALAEDYERDIFATLEEDDLDKLDELLETISQNLLKVRETRAPKRSREEADACDPESPAPEDSVAAHPVE